MNKYESSRAESKHQYQYAKNAEQEQRANDAKKSYNPLYPEKNKPEQFANDEEGSARQSSEKSPQDKNNDQTQ